MPDHIHVLITPLASLEKSVQFIKGGFSYRAKKELGSNMEVWQKGFSDHRIRDAADYQLHAIYIRENPVKKGLCEQASDYAYSSACPDFELDEVPQGLKPVTREAGVGAPEGAPFQNAVTQNTTTGEPRENAAAAAGVFQNGVDATPVQTKLTVASTKTKGSAA